MKSQALTPSCISKNPVVRVVFPSGSCREHKDAFMHGVDALRAQGFDVRYSAQRLEAAWRGYLSGHDSLRAQELCDALTEPDVDIVWFGRGGSGCNRITQRVIDHVRGSKPRVLIGFSDATSLLNGLSQHLGWTCYHGPVITTLGRADPCTSITEIYEFLTGQKTQIELQNMAHSVSMEGQLFGGNLTVLASMLGTSYAPEARSGSIWLLEDVGESPYRIDRSFRQLKDAGIFEGASGLWIGDFDAAPNDQAHIEEILKEDAPCPVIVGAPAGHRGPLSLLPIGARIKLSQGLCNAQWVTL